MSGSGRPLPVPDDNSRGYWESTARNVLAIARCSRCMTFNHPPDGICSACGSTEPDFVFTPMSGRGTIKSWTMIRHALVPGFEDDVPFLLVDVELAEQAELRLTGRLLDGPDTPLHLGAAVRVDFEDVAPGIAVPAFVLETAR